MRVRARGRGAGINGLADKIISDAMLRKEVPRRRAILVDSHAVGAKSKMIYLREAPSENWLTNVATFLREFVATKYFGKANARNN